MTLSSRFATPLIAPFNKRFFLHAIAGISALVVGTMALAAPADTYPDRLIKLVVPFPAGGPTDIVARPLAHDLSVQLKQTVVIENKGGAGGAIAADSVAKSPADGYTLLVGTVGTQAINAALYKKLSYDPAVDFTPLGVVAAAPVAIVVNAKSPYQTLGELVAAAKKKPAGITFGSAGNGTPGHLTGEMFSTAAGIKFAHIPYRGSAPAVTDLLGQQIEVMFDPVQSVLPHIQSGKLRVLAISGAQRSPVLPQVPTVAESGYKQFEAEAWWAIYAPANLPASIASQLSKNIAEIVASASFRDRLSSLGVTPVSIPPGPYAKFGRNELEKWGKAVHESGAQID
ncbi:LacI family transcriptional regulator [Herminiimonas sp. KBW02]|uniref:Bug family tripartite tricarboxylate transporter substrate binding protein n=1 Tax=Herminiimonas sp. KBW02 TaxID=2153363 RepID=UPI000F5B82B9|nr:tripartite tricarboxylate transporter substrate binding protein [Herminiimonas sp. KBW02]RQO33528.1 LacI family transcriptional regulator [Herminiimonas sp. KBW02]